MKSASLLRVAALYAWKPFSGLHRAAMPASAASALESRPGKSFQADVRRATARVCSPRTILHMSKWLPCALHSLATDIQKRSADARLLVRARMTECATSAVTRRVFLHNRPHACRSRSLFPAAASVRYLQSMNSEGRRRDTTRQDAYVRQLATSFVCRPSSSLTLMRTPTARACAGKSCTDCTCFRRSSSLSILEPSSLGKSALPNLVRRYTMMSRQLISSWLCACNDRNSSMMATRLAIFWYFSSI
mmetsp:Transcript_5489/g.13853  ORF Transcript_5489/g.13853 Transcript_5489/m.13853 type:complete len:247 (-) Transcript_5489:1015-1755(-)